ncbi:nuclear transport factor 2 family protein [Rhodococcus qingshengii]|uniref:nuclear transport factor 2 family protein n=1 Tax=Rhodococcus qingshengii TaxID=334542 RepID=UPI001BE73D33|nr:nuclear transport factor 2 family protein [Rhodococcus qingshengii]MBT2269961.1 nuclear transport factor 2 family protein [Rhodococcus qingshengii]
MVTSNTLADLTDQAPHTPEQRHKAQLAYDLVVKVFVRPAEFDSAPFGDVYVQHNPSIPDGKEGLRSWAQAMVDAAPDAHLEIKRILVDGDYVAVHSHVIRAPGDSGMALVDMFRIKDDVVVEHWDLMQEVPTESANANTMF